MNKRQNMKIIDLLNKIANGEEVPKKIKYMGYSFEYDTNHKRYESYFDEQIWTLNDFVNVDDNLNDEVEILEEEKKIPEKIDVISWDKCIHDATHKEKELAIEINKTQELLNQVIDYLKSKGDE